MNQQEEYITKYFDWFSQLTVLPANCFLFLDQEHKLMDSIDDYYVEELPNDVEFIFQINKVSKLNLNTDNHQLEIEGELWVPLENCKKYGFNAVTSGTPKPNLNSNSIPVFRYFMELENEAELSNYQFGYNIRIWMNNSLMDN